MMALSANWIIPEDYLDFPSCSLQTPVVLNLHRPTSKRARTEKRIRNVSQASFVFLTEAWTVDLIRGGILALKIMNVLFVCADSLCDCCSSQTNSQSSSMSFFYDRRREASAFALIWSLVLFQLFMSWEGNWADIVFSLAELSLERKWGKLGCFKKRQRFSTIWGKTSVEFDIWGI